MVTSSRALLKKGPAGVWGPSPGSVWKLETAGRARPGSARAERHAEQQLAVRHACQASFRVKSFQRPCHPR